MIYDLSGVADCLRYEDNRTSPTKGQDLLWDLFIVRGNILNKPSDERQANLVLFAVIQVVFRADLCPAVVVFALVFAQVDLGVTVDVLRVLGAKVLNVAGYCPV